MPEKKIKFLGITLAKIRIPDEPVVSNSEDNDSIQQDLMILQGTHPFQHPEQPAGISLREKREARNKLNQIKREQERGDQIKNKH